MFDIVAKGKLLKLFHMGVIVENLRVKIGWGNPGNQGSDFEYLNLLKTDLGEKNLI